jgi:hypothetical protein
MLYLISLFLTFIIYVIFSWRKQKSHLPDLPWLNVNEKEIFATVRARYRCTFDYQNTIHRAYDLVWRSHEPIRPFC